MPNYKRLFIENSHVFITIVANERKFILIDNISILRESFKEAKVIYDFEIYAGVVLPDHMHLLLKPQNINEYPKIIRAIKYNFSTKFNSGGIAIPPYEREKCARALHCCHNNIWQHRYYEHTIRDEEDFNNHLDYIHYNPVKHGYTQNVKDWEFSSFDKFVKLGQYEKNWGSYKDIEKIKDLDYE